MNSFRKYLRNSPPLEDSWKLIDPSAKFRARDIPLFDLWNAHFSNATFPRHCTARPPLMFKFIYSKFVLLEICTSSLRANAKQIIIFVPAKNAAPSRQIIISAIILKDFREEEFFFLKFSLKILFATFYILYICVSARQKQSSNSTPCSLHRLLLPNGWPIRRAPYSRIYISFIIHLVSIYLKRIESYPWVSFPSLIFPFSPASPSHPDVLARATLSDYFRPPFSTVPQCILRLRRVSIVFS